MTKDFFMVVQQRNKKQKDYFKQFINERFQVSNSDKTLAILAFQRWLLYRSHLFEFKRVIAFDISQSYEKGCIGTSTLKKA